MCPTAHRGRIITARTKIGICLFWTGVVIALGVCEVAREYAPNRAVQLLVSAYCIAISILLLATDKDVRVPRGRIRVAAKKK